MDIKIELALKVMRAEFSKVSLVPDNEVGLADLVETCPAREESVDDWWEKFAILLDKLGLGQSARVEAREHSTHYVCRRRLLTTHRAESTGVEASLRFAIYVFALVFVDRDRRCPDIGLFRVYVSTARRVLHCVHREVGIGDLLVAEIL